MKHISRIDSGHTHGWFVRVERNKKERRKFFADKKNGSKEKALAKAKKYRKKLLDELPEVRQISEYEKRFYYPNGINGNRSTAVSGVYRLMKEMSSGNSYPYYQTTFIKEKGRPETRSLSINKHGEKEAFLKICELRKDAMLKTYGTEFDQDLFEQQVNEQLKRIRDGI